MLSKASERALVTDDMATTAARSCVGLMFNVMCLVSGGNAGREAARVCRV